MALLIEVEDTLEDMDEALEQRADILMNGTVRM